MLHNKTLSLLFFSFSLLTIHATAQDSAICYLRDDVARIREHNVDFIKMQLDVKFNTDEQKVFGEVLYTFNPIQPNVDTLFLDAPGINTKAVLFEGASTKFKTDSAGLTIFFPATLNWNKQYKLQVNYEAQPRKGIYFIGWDIKDDNLNYKRKNLYTTRKQIWTQGQGIDNRNWIPLYDDVNDKLLTELTITFDSAYTVISNGELINKKANTDKTTTWHYKMTKPMVPYLIMMAIDKYGYKDYPSKSGVTSRQYYYSNRPNAVVPTYQYSSEMMDWMVKQTGVAFPWTTYANVPVQDFMYGAMENTTATIYGDFYFCDERASLERPYIATNAHELTHQWFGDFITEYSATHHWLHESFATYYAKQFIHHIFGEDRYESDKRGEQNSAMSADNRDRFPVAHSKGGSTRHYPKGSAVIDMMRYVVGDSVFQKTIKNYLTKHAYSNVQTNDLKTAFMETAGMNLDWFFDEWIYRSGYPKYQIRQSVNDKAVVLQISQTQPVDNLTDYFKMPIKFDVYFTDGTRSDYTRRVEHKEDTVQLDIPKGKKVDFVLFDPASNIIKQVYFNKSFEELSSQLQKAEHLIDRYDALVALRDTPLAQKKALLLDVYRKKNYRMVQSEIISQLSSDTTSETVSLLKDALKDPDFLIRRSVIESVDYFPPALLPDVEVLLTDSSYITIETALRRLCKIYPDSANKYLEITRGIGGINNNVQIAWFELKVNCTGITNAESKPYLKALIDYSSYHFEFRTRVRAIEALQRLEYFDETVALNLLNAVTYTNNRLNGPAARALKNFLLKDDNREITNSVFESTKWLPYQEKAIKAVLQ